MLSSALSLIACLGVAQNEFPAGRVWVVDDWNGKVREYTLSGTPGIQLDTTLGGSGILAPWGCEFGPDGLLYVTDYAGQSSDTSQIIAFDYAGVPYRNYSSSTITNLEDITFGSGGRLFVKAGDASNSQKSIIKIFDPDPNVGAVGGIGQAYLPAAGCARFGVDGTIATIAIPGGTKVTTHIYIIDRCGALVDNTLDTGFVGATGLAIRGDGHVFVASATSPDVREFDTKTQTMVASYSLGPNVVGTITLAFGADNRLWAGTIPNAGATGASLVALDLSTGVATNIVSGVGAPFYQIAFSPYRWSGSMDGRFMTPDGGATDLSIPVEVSYAPGRNFSLIDVVPAGAGSFTNAFGFTHCFDGRDYKSDSGHRWMQAQEAGPCPLLSSYNNAVLLRASGSSPGGVFKPSSAAFNLQFAGTSGIFVSSFTANVKLN